MGVCWDRGWTRFHNLSCSEWAGVFDDAGNEADDRADLQYGPVRRINLLRTPHI
jgi:hypothetical protein